MNNHTDDAAVTYAHLSAYSKYTPSIRDPEYARDLSMPRDPPGRTGKGY